MMFYVKDAWRLLWPLLIAIAVSTQIDSAWPLTLLLACFLGWQVWQKWRLARWLARGDLLNPPHAGGLWENYYTRLMHLFRIEQKTQQKLADIITRARNSADTLDEGIALLSLDFHLIYYNRAASELLGLVQIDTNELLTNLLRDPSVHDYFSSGDFSQPLLLPVPWRHRMLRLKLTPLAQEGFLLRIEDVTHLHKLEALRRDFVANVSHELKTPITVFKGSLELLQANADCLNAPYQALLTNMQQQSERMESLVTSLLLLARLEGQAAPLKEPLSLSALCQKLQSTFTAKALAKQQSLQWEITEGLSIKGVESELESAFGNLLDNAIQYSPAGSLIKAQCYQHNEELIFSVQDNGPGIDERHLPHLTERFYRIEKSRDRYSGGTGLGLAIVKHVLQRHQGRLSISSQLGQGSRFSCIFTSPPSEPHLAPQITPSQRTESKT
ncbi:MAG: phosphate regulon sensor histidine kinase PhoR [Venatoribacter sp.]